MLVRVFATLLLFTSVAVASEAVDWSQPPVGCVEEVVPTLPDRPCLDLSSVADPESDWPAIESSELSYWQLHRPQALYCRAQEVFRREKIRPGSFSRSLLEDAWLKTVGIQDSDAKISAIYKASRTYEIPVQVLTGAINQESEFAELGIGADGGNYSCGIGQGNILEWCRWASVQTPETQLEIGWPQSGSNSIDCSILSPSIVKPFYDIALTRLGHLAEYKMTAAQFEGIQLEDVEKNFPPASPEIQNLRYEAALSFIHSCSDPVYGILAKAHELELLHRQFVPAGLKKQGVYPDGEKFQRSCKEEGYAGDYPLNLGWLLAVGMFNSGPRAIDALAYYYGWNLADLRDPHTWDGMGPEDFIKAFYWAGSYDPKTDLIDFTELSGAPTEWIWFKPCVLQRHIARVIQHVTLPEHPNLVDSLEGAAGCAKSKFDPVTGALLESAVPRARQLSSGRASGRIGSVQRSSAGPF
jgi:hypothetical protein